MSKITIHNRIKCLLIINKPVPIIIRRRISFFYNIEILIQEMQFKHMFISQRIFFISVYELSIFHLS